MMPQSEILQAAKLIRNYAQFKAVRSLQPYEILAKHGDSIRAKLEPDSPTAVLICAWNEEKNLPFLLYSLAMNAVNLHPVVVDNNSTDSTAQIATELGATVITENSPGLIVALTTGFRYLAEKRPTAILHTDADCYTQPTWSSSLLKSAAKYIPAEGGQLFSPVLFCGSLLRDVARTSISFTLDLLAWRHAYSRPHGPNGMIVPDKAGDILHAVSKLPQEKIVTGTDDYIHHQVLGAGGKSHFHPTIDSVVFTSGNRYASLLDVFRTFLNPAHRKVLYRSWYQRQNGGEHFVSGSRPTFLQYSKDHEE